MSGGQNRPAFVSGRAPRANSIHSLAPDVTPCPEVAWIEPVHCVAVPISAKPEGASRLELQFSHW
jgi:hypothetical protein